MKYKKYNIKYINENEKKEIIELNNYDSDYIFKLEDIENIENIEDNENIEMNENENENERKEILIHSSEIENFDNIIRNGLEESESEILKEYLKIERNCLYGRGIYLSNSIEECNKYSKEIEMYIYF